jgi:hypothetical protein
VCCEPSSAAALLRSAAIWISVLAAAIRPSRITHAETAIAQSVRPMLATNGYPFFLPVKVLSRVFRGKFTAGLKKAFRKRELSFPGALQPLAQETAFRSLLRSLFRQDWVVYAKPPFGGPQHVLHYLALYTHRVAISNHRLVALTDGQVTFRWKDYGTTTSSGS